MTAKRVLMQPQGLRPSARASTCLPPPHFLRYCVYIDVGDNKLNLTNEVDSLILLPLNIRSLNKYHDDIHEFITLLPFSPGVICLSESRINQSTKNIQIPGYNFVNVKPDK